MKYVCVTCQVEKDSSEFYADKRNIFKGVVAKCKQCAKAWQAEHRLPYTPKDRERGQRWRDLNIEHARMQEKAKRTRNKALYRAAVRRYQAAKLQRTPFWSEVDLIKDVYRKAEEFGFEVDHVVPLQHLLVSGLHVWNNLQLLDRKVNCAKSNKHWPDMPVALPAAKLQVMTTP